VIEQLLCIHVDGLYTQTTRVIHGSRQHVGFTGAIWSTDKHKPAPLQKHRAQDVNGDSLFRMPGEVEIVVELISAETGESLQPGPSDV
jgi:hypothetical protein